MTADGPAIIAGLLFAGFLLLAAEVFLPGYIAGVLGFLCLATAVGVVFLYYGPTSGLVAALIVGGSTLAGVMVWLNIFQKTFIGRRVVLTSRQPRETPPGIKLVGEQGEALTPLRPSGSAWIAGRRVDVAAIGEFLEEGAAVVVVAADGLRVAVRRKDGLESSPPSV